MRKSSFAASVAALVAVPTASIAFVAQLAGCGGDDTSSAQAGPDASEASVTDTSTADMTTPADDGPSDSSSSRDGASDGGTSVMLDGDSGDAQVLNADGAACAVSVPTVGEYFGALASTVCQSLKSCCGTGANFDTASCLSTYGNPAFGGFLGVGFAVPYLDGGRIAYDPAAACQCLEGVASVNCGLIPGQTLLSLQQTCLAAIHGTVPITTATDAGNGTAAGCASSYECVSGAYCTANAPTDPTDASLGSCSPLVSDGGACTSELQCSYLANGVPSLQCSGTCIPRLEAGAACGSNTNCSSNVCASSGAGSICASGEVFSTMAACAFFTIPDAGDGG